MLRRRALVALEQHSEVAGELKVWNSALALTAERIRVVRSTQIAEEVTKAEALLEALRTAQAELALSCGASAIFGEWHYE